MEGQIDFNYQARYHTLGNVADSETIWFVLHGYGQLAEYFIRKFQGLKESGHCIIAPEGLSRFYLFGFTGRVGATWMTKEDRETDIKNYVAYLNAIFDHEIGDNNRTINILGFSQGAATASRWITQSSFTFNKLVLWAGIFPPDMNIDLSRDRLRDKQTFLVYGTQDKYFTTEKLIEQKRIVSSLNIQPTVVTFDGEHDIDPRTLLKIAH